MGRTHRSPVLLRHERWCMTYARAGERQGANHGHARDSRVQVAMVGGTSWVECVGRGVLGRERDAGGAGSGGGSAAGRGRGKVGDRLPAFLDGRRAGDMEKHGRTGLREAAGDVSARPRVRRGDERDGLPMQRQWGLCVRLVRASPRRQSLHVHVRGRVPPRMDLPGAQGQGS